MRPLEGLLGIGGDWQLAFVLEMLLRGGLLVAAAVAFARVGRNRAPGPRRAIWGGALVGALVAAVIAPFAIDLEFSFRVPYAWAHVDNVPRLTGVRGELAAAVLPGFVNGGGAARGPGAFGWLFLAWLAGVLALTLRLGLGLRRLRALRRDAQSEPAGARIDLLNDVRRQLGVRREVALAWSSQLQVPATFGSWRSILLLPETAERWPLETLRAVFLHELAHVRRYDWMLQVVGRLACIVYWFHPAIWWAYRNHTRAIEAAADRTAAEGFGSPAGYARQLLEATRDIVGAHPYLPAVTTTFTTGRDIERRVRDVLGAGRALGDESGGRWLIGAMGALALVSAVLAPVMGGCF